MIKKRFTYLKKDIYTPQIVITDNSTEKDLTPTDCYDLLNELNEENKQLKSELQRIYDVATLKKAWNIVNEIYDDLLYETSEKSDYARDKLLECLEMLNELGDELE